MAEKQPSESIYNQILKSYGECPSVLAMMVRCEFQILR